MEPYELQQAIAAFGYRLSPQTLSVLTARYSSNGRIWFDDFVSLCVKLRVLTSRTQLCVVLVIKHIDPVSL